MHTGNRLAEWVLQCYSSKAECARALGISPQLLGAYCKSKQLRWETVEKLASHWNMSADQFLVKLHTF